MLERFVAGMSWAVVALLCTPLCHAQSDLNVQVQLSKTSAMLGEPLWIELTVTNRGSETVSLIKDGTIEISIPGATQEKPPAAKCSYGEIVVFLPTLGEVAPGEVLRRRLPMEGDFRIAQSGRYIVEVYTVLRSPHGIQKIFADATYRLPLEVTPADTAKLLTLEQSLEDEALQIYRTNDQIQHASPLTLENLREKDERVADMQTTVELLKLYPVPGMELVFEKWANMDHFGDGIGALSRLNTAQARAALARLATPASAPKTFTAEERQLKAAITLVKLGDRRFLPILEDFGAHPGKRALVQHEALTVLGELGGESELPLLDHIARTSQDHMVQIGAVRAMADTGSAKAVPMLIDLFDVLTPDTDPRAELVHLTHHLLPEGTPNNLQAIQTAWKIWWANNQGIARTYGPTECMKTRGRWLDEFVADEP